MGSSVAEGQCPERKLRVGLIGTGKMGLQHLKAIAATAGATVIGVADPAADRDLLEETPAARRSRLR